MGEELEVLLYGHPGLRERCEEVVAFDDGLRLLAADMEIAMYAEQGIGLAAPQVGRPVRMLIAEDAREGTPIARAFVNPEVVEASRERDRFSEGCLSLPEIFEEVLRPVSVRVRYQDLGGREREVEDDGLLARILQHEIDHLDGVLFVDRLSMLKRKLIARRLKDLQRRAQEQQGRGV